MRYRLSLPEPHTHLFHVELELSRPGDAEIVFPVWTPGSYLVRDFAKHVQELRASAGGEPVAIERLDKRSFRCAPCAGPPGSTAGSPTRPTRSG